MGEVLSLLGKGRGAEQQKQRQADEDYLFHAISPLYIWQGRAFFCLAIISPIILQGLQKSKKRFAEWVYNYGRMCYNMINTVYGQLNWKGR